MKKIGIVLLCFFFINFTYCQGITNISISPPYPTENDFIIISVFQTYNSSGCPLYSKDISNNKISINDYPKGLYFMKITYGNREKK